MAEKFLYDNFQAKISVFASGLNLDTVPAGEFWYVKEWAWFLDGPKVTRFGRDTFPGSITFEIRITTTGGNLVLAFKDTVANRGEGGRFNRTTILQPGTLVTYTRIAAPISSGFLLFKASFIRRQP